MNYMFFFRMKLYTTHRGHTLHDTISNVTQTTGNDDTVSLIIHRHRAKILNEYGRKQSTF